ncbi:MAG TPA: class I SAM-dependent methyltransferase, partial [Promineifilum sp.]|nr:class I SAM-dependent methyltransferase [Promineifilum sp.]
MDSEALAYLLGPHGRALLDELTAESLSPDTRLARHLEPGIAAAVMEMALLRQRAARKFSRADCMFFTRDGLEQATAEPVAIHRAGRYAAAGIASVADLGCGIGGDALALAGTGAQVIAVDKEWNHIMLARENAAVYDVGEYVHPVLADLTELPALAVGAFFFDPARRT